MIYDKAHLRRIYTSTNTLATGEGTFVPLMALPAFQLRPRRIQLLDARSCGKSHNSSITFPSSGRDVLLIRVEESAGNK